MADEEEQGIEEEEEERTLQAPVQGATEAHLSDTHCRQGYINIVNPQAKSKTSSRSIPPAAVKEEPEQEPQLELAMHRASNG